MRSRDGRNFETIGTVTARGSNNSTEEYQLNNPYAYNDKNFYHCMHTAGTEHLKNRR